MLKSAMLTVFGQNLRGYGPKNRRLLPRPFEASADFTYTYASAVRWPSGRRRRFAKPL